MVNYANSVVYKIMSLDPEIDDVYVGSTTDYKNIKINHKSNPPQTAGERAYLPYGALRATNGAI